MKNEKSHKPPATSATSATSESGFNSLLGAPIDPKDPLAFIDLGFGASQRAKNLVLKGLKTEQQEEIKLLLKNEVTRLDLELKALKKDKAKLDKLLGRPTGRRGRPPKGWLSMEVEHAAAVIDAADLYFQWKGKKFSTHESAIDLAIQINRALVENGEREPRLFLGDMPSIRNAVSKGLKEFPEYKDFFMQK